MEWRFRLEAEAGQRLVMRVAQVLDQQQELTMLGLNMQRTGGRVSIALEVSCGEAVARRMEAKLWHLQDVDLVELEPVEDAVLAE